MFKLFKKKEMTLVAPCDGEVVQLTQVPDEVFGQKMMGDGFAIKPTITESNGVIHAPCDGKIAAIFHTLHAVMMTTDNGLELIVHIGLETVALKGEGFKAIAKEGDEVKAGDPLIRVDWDYLKSQGKELITPVVVTNMEIVEGVKGITGTIKKGTKTCTVVLK